MIDVHVKYFCGSRENRDGFLKFIGDNRIGEITRGEKGNIMYSYFIPVGCEDTVFLLERWEDIASIEAHSAAPHFAKLQEGKKQFVQSAEIARYDSEPRK